MSHIAALILLTLIIPITADAQSVSLTPLYNFQKAKNYDGQTEGAKLNVDLSKKYKFGLLYEHKTRSYTGSEIDDSLYGASFTYAAKRFYIENDGYWTQDYIWLPKYSLTTTPHYVFRKGWDAGVGFNYKVYPADIYKTYSPSLGKYIGSFFVRAQENITTGAQSTFYSSQGQVRYYFKDDLYTELSGAAGKTTEDQGVVESFHDWGISGKVNISKLFNLILQFNAHRSESIQEDSYGFVLELNL